MAETPSIHATRLPLRAWNSACRLVGGDPIPLDEDDRAALTASPLVAEGTTLDDRWSGLIASYLGSPSSVRISASHGGLLYRTSLALGVANVCVLERFTTRPTSAGGLATVNRDDHLEVSVTTGHPWTLLRRVLPPLANLRADSRQTSSRTATPVQIPDAVLAWAQEQCLTHPSEQVLATLRERSSGRLHDFLSADGASVSYAWTTQTPRGPSLALAWYVASPEHLFRATFAEDHPFEEVHAGDLAFTFDWHLLGALDALGAPAA